MFLRKRLRSFCLYLTAIWLFFPVLLSSQSSEVEQLKIELTATETDTARLRLLLDLAALFQQQMPVDIIRYSEEALALAGDLGDRGAQMEAYYSLAVGCYFNGKGEEALSNSLQSLAIAEEIESGT